MQATLQPIAIIRSDGGLSIMRIVVSAPLKAYGAEDALARGFVVGVDKDGGEFWDGGITDDGIADEIKRAGIDAVSWRRIDEADVPSDRAFRDAWVDDGKSVSHDLDKAREIVRSRIRAARDFSALDATATRLQTKAALGTLTAADKATLAATEAQRQELRDAPADPAIDAATDLDALKSLLPLNPVSRRQIGASEARVSDVVL